MNEPNYYIMWADGGRGSAYFDIETIYKSSDEAKAVITEHRQVAFIVEVKDNRIYMTPINPEVAHERTAPMGYPAEMEQWADGIPR